MRLYNQHPYMLDYEQFDNVLSIDIIGTYVN